MWRQKLKRFANLNGLDKSEGSTPKRTSLYDKFGPGWGYRYREAILNISLATPAAEQQVVYLSLVTPALCYRPVRIESTRAPPPIEDTPPPIEQILGLVAA